MPDKPRLGVGACCAWADFNSLQCKLSGRDVFGWWMEENGTCRKCQAGPLLSRLLIMLCWCLDRGAFCCDGWDCFQRFHLSSATLRAHRGFCCLSPSWPGGMTPRDISRKWSYNGLQDHDVKSDTFVVYSLRQHFFFFLIYDPISVSENEGKCALLHTVGGSINWLPFRKAIWQSAFIKMTNGHNLWPGNFTSRNHYYRKNLHMHTDVCSKGCFTSALFVIIKNQK